MLSETYGEHSPAIKPCETWFRRFKSGDYDVSDRAKQGGPKKYEDADLQALLDEDLKKLLIPTATDNK